MNPRVRVREQEEPVPRQEVSAAYLLRVIESLSLENPEPLKAFAADDGSSSKVEKNTSYAKVSCHISKDPLAETPAPKGKSKKHSVEENIIHIRASSVPMPRAVLSSPDNDGIFGNRNKRNQGTTKSAESPALIAPNNPIYSERTNKRSPLSTQRAATSTQTSSHMYTKNFTNKNAIGAKRHSFSLSTHNQPKASGDATMVEQALTINMQSALRDNGTETNGYLKIKCRELTTSKARTPVKKSGK